VFEIRHDDLSGKEIRALIALHLARMHSSSPPECTFALDVPGLKVPEITIWSVWDGSTLVGMGALKALDDGSGEIKSMRTEPKHLRRGVASTLLKHIIAEARLRGYRRLSLETGSGSLFEPALMLYRKYGFTNGDAFANYVGSEFNQFLHLEL